MRLLRTLFAAMIVLNLGGLSMAAEKAKTPGKEEKQGTVHTVTSSMDYPTNSGVGIQAEKRPGEFTIPKDTKGTKLKYQFFNPKSGNTLTKINGRNIYSVTEHRYMKELDGNPDFELPPGDYKFVVGGEPGAIGTLNYTTVPSSDTNPPPKTPPPHGTTKRKPTEKTDKTEDKNTVTALPGAGKKKVVVVLVVDAAEGKLDAWLTIDGNKLTLDFIFPVFEGHLNVVKNYWRWEGTLERGTTVSGKTNYESNSIYEHGRNTRFTVKGDFTATLEGNVVTGTFEEHTAWASDGAPPAWRRKGRWRIDGISP